jgi:NF-kappa-B inhibitor-interacting Ras-like protein
MFKQIIMYPQFLQATIEDIYVACVETERGTKEKVRFYDTAGLESVTVARQVCQSWQADGYVMVYDTSRPETLDLLVQLKKEIDKNKEKKEVRASF